MPGLSAYDFGDSIRFGANDCAEDEPDQSKVHFSLHLYKVFAEGYLAAAGSAMTEAERRSLPWGAKLMTLECGIRFLTDYLEGDPLLQDQPPGPEPGTAPAPSSPWCRGWSGIRRHDAAGAGTVKTGYAKSSPAAGRKANRRGAFLCRYAFVGQTGKAYAFFFMASSTETATATVAPTMGLLPMPRKPIISTCAGTELEPAN